MKQRTARFKVEGQDIIYDKENSDTGFVANTMGLYYIEITFSSDWSDCDKIYLLLNNGRHKEKMLMTKVSGTTYRNLINNVFVSTSALTLGCVGYKTSDPSLRYITDPDSRNLTFIPSVDLNEETLNQTQITEMESIRLKVDGYENDIKEMINSGEIHVDFAGIQSDWNQEDDTQADYIKNKPTIFDSVQSDWNQTDSAQSDYIKNKPVIKNNVQPDWNQTDSTQEDYIKNKPTIKDNVQSDWNQTDATKDDYIKNKPVIENVQANWAQTDTTKDDYIKNKPTVAEEQADWNQTDKTKINYIKNKPNLTQATIDDDGYITFPAVGSGSTTGGSTGGENNVQSDWEQTDESQDDYIKNKPTLLQPTVTNGIISFPTVTTSGTSSTVVTSVQADWAQIDDTQLDYIKNKPDIIETSVKNGVFKMSKIATTSSSGASSLDIQSLQDKDAELESDIDTMKSDIANLKTSGSTSVVTIDQSEDSIDIPKFYSPLALYQNYYDDSLTDKTGPMLRTDTAVCNQANFGVQIGQTMTDEPLKLWGDATCFMSYNWFYWNDVQTASGTYDFSSIKTHLEKCVTQKKRTGLRIFPSCRSRSTSGGVTSYNGYYISFPTYIVDLMTSNSGQFAYYNSQLLIDINLDVVYEEYRKLLYNFAQWLNSTKISDTYYAKDLVSYIDFGLFGPWGEGDLYSFQITVAKDKITRYVSYLLSVLPDTQINIGYTMRTDRDNVDIINQVFIASKELKNNAGYVGIFLDNIGSKNPQVFNTTSITDAGDTPYSLLNKYGARGDFATGEFSMFTNQYWNGQAGLWAYPTFKVLRMPHIRISNITMSTGIDSSIKVSSISPYLLNVLNNAMACVGFRFVITNFRSTALSTTQVRVEIEIENIGLSRCFFDIYDLCFRVYDKSSSAYYDVSTGVDLTAIKPNSIEPLQYGMSMGKYIRQTISDIPYSSYKIAVIGKDKIGFQNPLYFSNYERNSDGSYTILA